MESVNSNGIPVGIFIQPVTKNGETHQYDNDRRDLTRRMTILGSLQIAFGMFCIIFEVVCVIIYATYDLQSFAVAGYGFWIGIFFIITGAFGCAGGRRNNRGFMITFNVLSIISAATNVLLISLAAISIFILEDNERFFHYLDSSSELAIRKAEKASIAMESLMITMAVAETIVAIWSSVVCCKVGACCCDCGDACCCPPALVPTQILMPQQPIGVPQQQPLMLYGESYEQQPVANVYQQKMADPNNLPETDFEVSDHIRLCV